MARRVKDEQKYDSRLYIRCMSDQKARIQSKAEDLGFNTNTFVVNMALNGEVIVNDNSVSIFELGLIRQLQQVGQWLNKSFTHRANITGDLPNELWSCLREVEQLLDYVSLSLKFHGDYLDFAKAEDAKHNRERSYSPAISQGLAFQLYGLDNNLTQLNSIAMIRDIHPRELSACLKKVNILLNRIS